MLRVVLDTNVLISGLLWTGPPARVYDTVVEQDTLLISTLLFSEVATTLSRAKFAARLRRRGSSVPTFLEDLQNIGEFVEPAVVPATVILRDESDRYLLGMAIAGRADVIVTGDRDLLVVELPGKTRILTPAQFLAFERR